MPVTTLITLPAPQRCNRFNDRRMAESGGLASSLRSWPYFARPPDLAAFQTLGSHPPISSISSPSPPRAVSANGGVGGIRTPEGLHPTHFPSVRLKPLGHDSVEKFGQFIKGKRLKSSARPLKAEHRSKVLCQFARFIRQHDGDAVTNGVGEF